MSATVHHIPMRGGWANFAKVIRQREPFSGGGGTMHGRPVTCTEAASLSTYGWLPPGWANMLRVHGADYIVFDYQTPIAWHRAGEPGWIIPDVKYTKTSTRHQNLLKIILPHVSEAWAKQAARDNAAREASQ